MPKLKDKTTSCLQMKKIQKNMKNVEKCSIPGCTKTYSKHGKMTLFFKFPLDNKRVLKKWLQNINLTNWMPIKTDRICSDHFENHNISKINNVYELDQYAIPSIKPKIPYCVINSKTQKNKKVKNEKLIEKPKAKNKQKLNKKLTGKIVNKDTRDNMNNENKIELKLEIPKINDQLFTELFTKYNMERTNGKIENHTTNEVEVYKSKTIKEVEKNEYISAKSPDLFDMATPKIKNKQYIAVENISELKKLPTKATGKTVIKEMIQKPCPKSKKIDFQSKPYSRLIISPRKCPGCKRSFNFEITLNTVL